MGTDDKAIEQKLSYASHTRRDRCKDCRKKDVIVCKKTYRHIRSACGQARTQFQQLQRL